MERQLPRSSASDITINLLLINLVLLLFFLSIISCSGNKKIVAKKVPGFNSRIWKKDSLACDHIRETLVKVLVDNKNQLIGKTKQQVLSLLGKPNGDKNNVMGYFVENGTQCSNLIDKNFDHQVRTLLIEFQKDTVIDVYVIIP